MEQKHIEEIFDIINEGCVFLFEKKKMNYLDSLLMVTTNLMDYSTIDIEEEEEYEAILNKMQREYEVEEVRKALQYLVLNAFKEVRYANTITPDAIALLMAYLVDKLYGKKPIAILDPMVGSANLLTAIANARQECILYGIDIEETMIKIAKMVGDMLNLSIYLYCQDTLTVRLSNMDLIVCDIPFDNLLTYKTISYHLNSLKKDGYMLLLIGNDFFTNIEPDLKKQIDEVATMQGIIELPKQYFKDKIKSVVIIKKNKEPIKEFLLAQMPSDMDAMNRFLKKIDMWFSVGGK